MPRFCSCRPAEHPVAPRRAGGTSRQPRQSRTGGCSNGGQGEHHPHRFRGAGRPRQRPRRPPGRRAAHSAVPPAVAHRCPRWIPARMRPPTLNARKPAWPSTHTAPASLALVRRLLACGADANARDGYGRTPLEYAAKAGTVAVLRALVGGGADLRLHSPAALSPFRAAAEPRRRPREARAERLQVRWALRRCTASTCCLIRRRVSGDARVLWDWDCCQVTCKYLRATGCDAGSAFKHACWNPTFPQVLLEHPDLVALHWDGLQSAGVGHAAPGTLALHLAQLPLDAMCTAVQELLSTAAEVQARRWGRLREAWVSAVVRTTWLGRASRTGR